MKPSERIEELKGHFATTEDTSFPAIAKQQPLLAKALKHVTSYLHAITRYLDEQHDLRAQADEQLLAGDILGAARTKLLRAKQSDIDILKAAGHEAYQEHYPSGPPVAELLALIRDLKNDDIAEFNTTENKYRVVDVLEILATQSRWVPIIATSPSGKRQWVCRCCGRVSVTPDKNCPENIGPINCREWEEKNLRT